MPLEYDIVETFEITGRGVAAVIDEITDRGVGRSYRVEVVTPSGDTRTAEAFKEWLLKRTPEAVEKETYLLIGLHMSDVPAGSRLRFIS